MSEAKKDFSKEVLNLVDRLNGINNGRLVFESGGSMPSTYTIDIDELPARIDHHHEVTRKLYGDDLADAQITELQWVQSCLDKMDNPRTVSFIRNQLLNDTKHPTPPVG